MEYSIGKNLTAGTSNTLFTVPTGYHAKVTMLLIANVGGSSKTVSGTWHDGATSISFQGAKSVSAGETLKFGGPPGEFLLITEGDYISVTPEAGSTFTAIVSFDLFPHRTSNFVF